MRDDFLVKKRNESYFNFHDQFVNVLFHGFRLDRDLGRFLDDVVSAEPRNLRLWIGLALALHRDQGTGFVRNDAGFLDERRCETRSFFCVLERSTVRQESQVYIDSDGSHFSTKFIQKMAIKHRNFAR